MKARINLGIFWWLHPVPVVFMALVPFLISGHMISGADYFDLWRTEKHLDYDTAVLCAAIVASFTGGAFVQFLMEKRHRAPEATINYYRLEMLFLASFVATLFGYILWIIVCATHGVGLAQVISVFRGDFGAVYAIRDLGATIPGLTTMTQFGMAAAIFGSLLWNERHPRYVVILLVLLVVMAMVRALLWSERLATIEVLIPMLITLFARRDWYSHPRLRRFLGFAPIAGCVGLYLYFTASESVRSWGHYAAEGGSIWYFSWMRLCGYYITALNNGALMHKVVGTAPFPYTAFEFFWKFPGISTLFPYNDMFSVDPYAYLDSLKDAGNPEFNNPSGIFPYVVDFGTIGACVFWFLAGWLGSAAHSAFQRGALAGLLFFPLLFISYLEISRIPYLTASRTLPSWAMLAVALLLVKKRPARFRGARLQRRRSGSEERARSRASSRAEVQEGELIVWLEGK